MALHLSARPNCLAEYRDIGKVEWLFVEPLYEFRRCKTLGGGRYSARHAFAQYRTALSPTDAERLAGVGFEAAARNFAGAAGGRGGQDASKRREGNEEESLPHPQPNSIRGGRPPSELPEGYVRRNGVVGRMVEVGASGLLLAASGTVRPVKKDDAWRIGFVDAKRGGDRWSGLFENETDALLAIGDARFMGGKKSGELGLYVGGLKNGGWRG